MSHATAGSEPKSVPEPLSGGGRGRSTAPQVEPPSEEKYPRIGNRSISFEPPTIWAWLDGLIAIDVSLCGPASLLTSMLEPTETLPVFPGLGSGRNPGADTVRNFCHQVGSLYAEAPVLVPAEAGSAQPTVNAILATAAAVTKARSRAIRLAPPDRCVCPEPDARTDRR